MFELLSWLFKSKEQKEKELLSSGHFFRSKDGTLKPKVLRVGRRGFRAHPEWLSICVNHHREEMKKYFKTK